MANYLQLKKQFNSNKKFIKQVLNDQKCQLRLQAEGLSTLNNLINQNIKKITSLPKYDNCEYSYIFFNNKKLNKTYLKLKKWGLIRIIDKKGGYTGITYRYITLNLDKFNKFFINTQKYFHPQVSLA